MKQMKWIEVSLVLLLMFLIGFAFNVTLEIKNNISGNGMLKQGNQPIYHFAVIADDVDSYSWNTFMAGVEDEASKKNIVIEISEVKDPYDNNALVKTFEMARLSKVDGVMVRLSNNNLAHDEIQKCYEEGIKVITIGNDSPESKRDAYIGTNKFNLGKITASLLTMADSANEQLDVLLILGSEFTGVSGASSNSYLNGIHETVKNSEIVDQLYVEYASEKRAELIVNDSIYYKNIDAIICTDPIDSLRAIKVLIDLNKVGQVHFIGSSDLPEIVDYIKKGTIESSVVEDYEMMGNTAVEVLYQLLDQHRQSAYISIPIKVIDRESLSVTE